MSLVQISSKLEVSRRNYSKFYWILNLEASLNFHWKSTLNPKKLLWIKLFLYSNPSHKYFIWNFSITIRSFLDRSKFEWILKKLNSIVWTIFYLVWRISNPALWSRPTRRPPLQSPAPTMHACQHVRAGVTTPPPESASYLPPSTPPSGAPKPAPHPLLHVATIALKSVERRRWPLSPPRQFSSNEACADHNAPFLDLSSALAHRSSADPARFGRNRNAVAIAALRWAPPFPSFPSILPMHITPSRLLDALGFGRHCRPPPELINPIENITAKDPPPPLPMSFHRLDHA
jgi:hypothetical protein